MTEEPDGNRFGKYQGRVVTEWLVRNKLMELVEDFAYIDPAGERWEAPKGSRIDGASIPRPLWTIVGDPFDGMYRRASVVHDVACEEKTARWGDVHRMFYYAMRCDGVGHWRALYMFTAVYRFGPRWRAPGELFQIEMIPGIEGVEKPEPLAQPPQPTVQELRALQLTIEVERAVTTLEEAQAMALL